MNTVAKLAAVSGLVLTLAASLAPARPASAQAYHHALSHRAARLDRRASRANSHGRYRRAARLDRRSARLSRRAERGPDPLKAKHIYVHIDR